MKLYYYKDPHGNFGDDLNPWLWQRLLHKSLEKCADQETLFIGIGTLLNHKVPTVPQKKIVFGTGAGYGALPKITEFWDFICVRGPRTAAALGLPLKYAITDAAVLIREIIPPTNIISRYITFMPHHQTALLGDWKPVCDSVDIHYLDPAASIEETISTIRNSFFVLAESMHAAILAETYRIPWIPVCTSSNILRFKWLDWTESLGISHEFEYLQVPEIEHILSKFPNYPKDTTNRFSVSLEKTRPLFVNLVRKGKQYLSNDRVFDNTYRRLLDALNNLIEKI